MPTFIALGKSIALLAPAVWASFVLARVVAPWSRRESRFAASLIIFYALCVIGAGLLGVNGGLGYNPLLVFAWTVALAVYFFDRASRAKQPPAFPAEVPTSPISLPDAMLAALAATIVTGAVLAVAPYPAFEYDALTYHLHFPTQWLNAGRIFLVETPFGDAAPEYAPAHGSLWFTWLLAPWRDGPWAATGLAGIGVDTLARFGQLPFALLLASSLTFLARTLSGENAAATRPAALALIMPWVVWQSASPGVDLIFASCLISALTFGAAYASDKTAGAAALCGLSVGLAVGTKFVALVYLPIVLAAIVAWHGLGRVRVWDLIVFALTAFAFGAPWYLRNALLAGNPLFPAHIALAGNVIFDGAYTREAMKNSVFHVPGLGSALVVAAHAFGYPLAFAGIAGWVRSAVASRASRPWLVAAIVIPAAFAWHFVAVPYSSQDRFLIWAAALAFLPAAVSDRGRGAVIYSAVMIVAILWQAFSPEVETQLWKTPVVFCGHFRVEALLAITAAWACFVAAFFTQPHISAPRPKSIFIRLGAAVGAVALIAAAGPVVRVPMSSLREMPMEAYMRLWTEQPECVAYAGRNRPFHLAGRDGRTRVVWVPVDGRDDEAFHDVIRQAASDGTLDRDRDKAPWRYARQDRGRWIEAFKRSRAQWLLIEPMGLEERGYLGYDEKGFPIERTWALETPELFEAVIVRDNFELYRVRG